MYISNRTIYAISGQQKQLPANLHKWSCGKKISAVSVDNSGYILIILFRGMLVQVSWFELPRISRPDYTDVMVRIMDML